MIIVTLVTLWLIVLGVICTLLDSRSVCDHHAGCSGCPWVPCWAVCNPTEDIQFFLLHRWEAFTLPDTTCTKTMYNYWRKSMLKFLSRTNVSESLCGGGGEQDGSSNGCSSNYENNLARSECALLSTYMYLSFWGTALANKNVNIVHSYCWCNKWASSQKPSSSIIILSS